MAPLHRRGWWRCAGTGSGGAFADVIGTQWMPMLCVHSLDSSVVRGMWYHSLELASLLKLKLFFSGSAVNGDFYGRSSVVMYMSNIRCRGSESKLIECHHSQPTVGSQCTTKDVGVKCTGML